MATSPTAAMLRARLRDAERDLNARQGEIALMRAELAALLDLEARLKLAEDRILRTTTTEDYMADAATIQTLEARIAGYKARAGA